jgi:hypothetical protein
MVMIEDNPYGAVQPVAARSDPDTGRRDGTLEHQRPGTGKTRAKGIIDIGTGVDVSGGYHGSEDGDQLAEVIDPRIDFERVE